MEIVVTMRTGERAVLRSFPPPLGLDPLSSRFTGGDDTLDVLFHEDAGMMGQFVVVGPGQKAGDPDGGHGGHSHGD